MNKMIARTGLFVSLAFALALTIACNSTQSSKQPVDDAAITAAVKSKLAADVELSTITDIEVDTLNGVVTLAGKVATADVKHRAEELTQNVDGVVRVTNNIEVSGA
jgi:hyperosmotically inducible periplasmic protein